MRTVIKILLTVTLCLQSSFSINEFLENYIEVSPLPPESIGPIPKCGDGVQKGKFICVPYFNCDPATNTVTDYPEVDASFVKEPKSITDPQCTHPLEVCCQVRSPIVASEHGPTVNLTFQPTCGVKYEGVPGNFTLFGETPWMVALLNKSDTSNRPFCGGSLLSPVVVLTAAHCVERFQSNQIKVRVGEWDLEAKDEKIPYQERNVYEVIIHEYYFPDALYNDVAILILDNSLHEADNIGTICLPKKLEEINVEDCLATGWGQISSNAYPTRLKKINLSKLANKLCQEALRKEVGKEFLLDRSFICATTKSQLDVCSKDGGGPLVCPDSSNRYFQIGIISWGVDCTGTSPNVYADVVQFRDWINFKLIELGYNSRSYTKDN